MLMSFTFIIFSFTQFTKSIEYFQQNISTSILFPQINKYIRIFSNYRKEFFDESKMNSRRFLNFCYKRHILLQFGLFIFYQNLIDFKYLMTIITIYL